MRNNNAILVTLDTIITNVNEMRNNNAILVTLDTIITTVNEMRNNNAILVIFCLQYQCELNTRQTSNGDCSEDDSRCLFLVLYVDLTDAGSFGGNLPLPAPLLWYACPSETGLLLLPPRGGPNLTVLAGAPTTSFCCVM